MSRFYVSDTNPNEDTGGAGTICGGEQRSEDCTGPYYIFPEVSTDSGISPHVVLCTHCLGELAESAGGDLPDEVIDAEVVDEQTVPEV